jgi:hypothetical protein
MLSEVTPSLLTRLDSLTLTLTSALQEAASIRAELRRREEEEKQKLSLPAAEWLSLDDAVKFLPGFKTREAFRQWAKVHGIEARKVGQKLFFHREELNAKLKAAPTPEAKPVVKKKPSAPIEDKAAESALDNLIRFKRGRHG